MPRAVTLGVRRAVPSSVLFGLIGVCAVLAVLCASLISTIVLLRQYQDTVDRRRELETVIVLKKNCSCWALVSS